MTEQSVSTSQLKLYPCFSRPSPHLKMSFQSLPFKLLRTSTRPISTPAISIARRSLSSTPRHHRKDPKMSSHPPKHEMVYFPNMTSLASSSGEFRKVLHTGLYSQLVLMTIPVGGDIGDEVHTVDQILTFTSGQAKATINGKDRDVNAGDLIIVPAGTQHQFVNTGKTPLVRVVV
jgi:mannose-6-phosphate isomerase-like protein (cupin superfamily)